MDKKIDYCWAKALEYTKRAEDATDEEVREFFYRLRDTWIRAANHRQAGLEETFRQFRPVPPSTPVGLKTPADAKRNGYVRMH